MIGLVWAVFDDGVDDNTANLMRSVSDVHALITGMSHDINVNNVVV